MNWEEIARAKDAYIEEIRKAMGAAVDSDLVSLATTLKVRDGVAELLEAVYNKAASLGAVDMGDCYEVPSDSIDDLDDALTAYEMAVYGDTNSDAQRSEGHDDE